MRFLVGVGILIAGAAVGYGVSVGLAPEDGADNHSIDAARAPVSAGARVHQTDYARSAGEAPRLALSDIAAMASDFDQTLALYQILAPLDASEIEKLIAQADGTLQGSDFKAATAIMVARLAELEPYLALELANGAAPRVRSAWLHAVFRAWARLDVQAAREAAAGLSLGARRIAGSAILSAREDLPLAERQEIASRLGTELLVARSGNFAEAWQLALDEPLLEQRYRSLAAIAVQWGMEDPVAAIAALERLPDGSIERGMTMQIVQGWARSDPQAALDWVLQASSDRQAGQLMQVIFAQMAQDDLTTALDIAHGLPDAYQVAAMQSLLPAWALADLSGATDWVRSETNAEYAGRYFRLLASAARSRGDGESWRGWFATLTDAEAEVVLPSVIDVLALEDAEAAAARVARMRNDVERNRAARGLLRQWAQQDPLAAVDWIDGQEASQRRAYRSRLLRSWIATDQAGALEFTLAQPAGEERDEFLLTLMGRLPIEEIEALRERIVSEENRNLADQLIAGRLERSRDTRAPIYVDPTIIDRR